MARNIRFKRIVTRTQNVVHDLETLQFSQFHAPSSTWEPAINVYGYEDRFEICVDLAGVEKEKIKVAVEPKRLIIKGSRPSPAPDCENEDKDCRHTLAMEIENGPFQRELKLPIAVNKEKVTARQDTGFLWITLPFAPK